MINLYAINVQLKGERWGGGGGGGVRRSFFKLYCLKFTKEDPAPATPFLRSKPFCVFSALFN